MNTFFTRAIILGLLTLSVWLIAPQALACDAYAGKTKTPAQEPSQTRHPDSTNMANTDTGSTVIPVLPSAPVRHPDVNTSTQDLQKRGQRRENIRRVINSFAAYMNANASSIKAQIIRASAFEEKVAQQNHVPVVSQTLGTGSAR
jgi:hypothetical protein